MNMPDERAEFPEEYFSECDEHLSVAREAVLALEQSVGQKQADSGLLDDLFRSFHSIKGLSAMVGIAEAERLAHTLESFLASLRRGAQALSADGLAALAGGVRTLDVAIRARRDGRPREDVTPAIAGITAATGAERTAAPPKLDRVQLTPSEKARLETALAAGAQARVFTFAPSPAFSERGITVTAVRERLRTLGELIHASPQVGSGGRVTFAFVIATTAADETLAALADEGILVAQGDPLAIADFDAPAPDIAPAEDIPRPRANLVRVDLAKLDELMRMVGELVVTRGRFEQTLRRTPAARFAEHRAFHETNAALERQLRELREAVTRVRLVPVREAFERMRFVVRDLTRGSDKTVSLELIGERTEVDKLVVERMAEPLLHLVRNAVSHGLESAAERIAAGKPAAGRLALRASSAGENVVIEVEDDGRGIDSAAVRSRAVGAGLIDADAEIGPAALRDILTRPGFSTRDEADRASGRGVGMAAVRAAVDELGGSLELSTRREVGTCFTLRLPLTLAILDALIVKVGEQRFAVPRTAVREILRIEREKISSLGADEILEHRGRPVPLQRLAQTFKIVSPPQDAVYVLIVSGDENPAGLVVDGIEGLREIVVRPLADPLVRQRGLSGATELGDRRAVLILDTKALVERRVMVDL